MSIFIIRPNLVWGNQEPMWTLKRAALKVTATPRLEQLARHKLDTDLRITSCTFCVPWSHCSCIHSLTITYTYCSPEFQYSCGRTSQIWRVSPLAMKATASQRIGQLSHHKTAPPDYLDHRSQFEYSCGRSSQIWTTSKPAMSCRPRPHTASLSRPKQTHLDYRPSRQVTLNIKRVGRGKGMWVERVLTIPLLKIIIMSFIFKGTDNSQQCCQDMHTFGAH